MIRFRFPLEKVLQYRARVLDTEQARLSERLARLHAVESELEAVIESRLREQERLRGSSAVDASELESLGAFLLRAALCEKRLREQLDAERKACDLQRECVLKARREHRLVERLRERRLKEWQQAYDRELQQTADENFTARWISEGHEKFI